MKTKIGALIKNGFSKVKALFRGGFFHILTGDALSRMVGFISSIAIVRIVSQEQYGQLSAIDNLFQYTDLFAGLGMATALLKYSKPAQDMETNRYYLNFSLKYGSLFQMGLSGLLAVYVLFGNISFPEARPLALVLLFFPVLKNVLAVYRSYIRSQMNNRLFANLGIVQTVVVFAGSVGFALLFDVYGIVVARYMAILLVIGIAVAYARKTMAGVKAKPVGASEMRGYMKFSLKVMVASMFSLIIPINEGFLVNDIIRNEVISAQYRVANLIPFQLMFIAQAIAIYSFPLVSQIFDGKAAYKKIKNAGLASFAIVLIIVVPAMLLTPFIFKIYGEQYAGAIDISYFFWIVHLFNAGIRVIPMNMLPAIGYTTFNMVNSVVSCLVHLGISYYAISNYGIEGVAYASAGVYLISGIVYWIYLRHVCLKKGPRKLT